MKNKASIFLIITIAVLAIVFNYSRAIEITPEELQQYSQQNLGASVLRVSQGGTGATSFDVGLCLYGNGTDAIYADDCAAGSMTALPSTQIYVGNTSNQATATSSVTVASDGLVTIQKGIKFNAFSATPLIYADSDTNTGVVLTAPDVMGLMTGGTSRLAINAMGYVGIGTTSPAYILDVYGNARIDGDITASNLNISDWNAKWDFATTTLDYWFDNTAGITRLNSYVTQAYASSTFYTKLEINAFGYVTQAYASSTFLTYSFDTATSTDTLYINKICNTVGDCWDTPGVTGSQIYFYPHNTDSDIATYEDMFTYPDGITPIDESCTADSDVDNGYCLIDTYISSTSDISILKYPAGVTKIRAYTYVSSAASDSRIVIEGYKRDSLGVETFIGQATTTEINQLTVAESIAQFTSGSDYLFNQDGTDRLVMKVYGWTDSNSARVIHWTYQNSGFYSHIETPITTTDIGNTKSYANETITGAWTFSVNPIFASLFYDPYGQATSTLASHTTTYNHANYDTAYGWGNHATAGYNLQSYASSTYVWASDWTTIDNYPSACSAGSYVSAIGDTLTCSEPTGTYGDSDVYGIVSATTTLPNITDLTGLNTYPAFSIASSTWNGIGGLTASSTIQLKPAYTAETWAGFRCSTDTGTALIKIGDGTNFMTTITASSTAGLITVSSNNTFTAGEVIKAVVSNIGATVNWISCSVSKKNK
jgi:hypothetical protein